MQSADGASDIQHVAVVGGRDSGSDKTGFENQTAMLASGLDSEEVETSVAAHLFIGSIDLQHVRGSLHGSKKGLTTMVESHSLKRGSLPEMRSQWIARTIP